MEKVINFEDAMNIAEEIDQKQSRKGLRGRVNVYDDLGNLILQKDNLIVMRGRTFALEKLFNSPIDAEESGYKVNMNRTISLFKIGSGGADLASTPFQPFTPVYSDEDLSQPVPFVVQDPKKNEDPEKENNPSIVEALSEEQSKKYYIPNVKEDGTTEFYGKVFESQPQWVFNKETNEVYKKITLKVNIDEARGFYINELGLVIAEYDEENNTFDDSELFSRITFDSESLTSLTKTLLFEYLIFA
ncbi:hypothetical protein Bp8pS_318 [Bacillus phage vB_BpuM-BpSp]|nr:hypothetical protein Bp8pS_318 [Bacillus phage vB_BpuM-BpSp]